MQSNFLLNADELNADFLDALKAMFLGRKIEMTVSDAEDETEYLLKSDANKSHLLSSISQIENARTKTLDAGSL